MKSEQILTNYLKTAYLIGLCTAVGVAAAITAVLALWPPLAHLAAKFF